MTLEVRDFSMRGQFAKKANTNVPPIPISGQAYRNPNITQTQIEAGQAYDAIGPSAFWNQVMHDATGLAKDSEIYGWPRWSPFTDYPETAGRCTGSDGDMWVAKKASGPNTPDPENPGVMVGPKDPTIFPDYWQTLTDYIKSGGDGGTTPGGTGNGWYNTRKTLTASGLFTAPSDGWYRITTVGGGGGGGKGGGDDYSAAQNRFGGGGGKRGGATSFGSYLSSMGGDGGGGGGHSCSAGGGGAGRVATAYVFLTVGQVVPYTIGGGGSGATGMSGNYLAGADGEGTYAGRGGGYGGGGGAPGAGCGGRIFDGGAHSYQYTGPGGSGATTGLPYGNGGGGGGGAGTQGGGTSGKGGRAGGPGANDGGDGIYSGLVPGNGGNGGSGVIFIDYYTAA